jgi:hypothetical protein
MFIDKVDWLAAFIALTVVCAVFVVFLRLGVKFAQPASHWEARADPEEIHQTLLTN